ncbi:MAG: VOC family protein [bacterium]|nr:lactoylglutathione lyase [Deltaproteobacteria bacterium]MCP4908856.1 VOC family protein [bacterium]
MTIEYLMHVGVCVRDLERSISFYRDGLGFKEAGRLEIDGEPTATMVGIPDLELRAIYLERDGVRIELLHYPTPGTVGPAEARPMNQPGLTHFAIRVSDLDEAIHKIEAMGGRVLEKTRIFNPVFDAHLVYATDPDGTRLELVQTPKDPTR